MTAESTQVATPTQWMWRKLPMFWAILFCVTLALISFGTAANHPARVQGWHLVGLLVLLLIVFTSYQLLSWGRVYGATTMGMPAALLCVVAQLVALALLSWQYDSTFGWCSLAVLYQSVGGVPRRYWPVPLVSVFVLLVLSTSPLSDTGALDPSSIVTGIMVFAGNVGIGFFLSVLNEQRDQLHVALDQLHVAHAALADNAAAAQELAVLRERTRLARAMHDDLGHALVVMNVKLEAAQLLYARDHARGDAELEASRALIRSTMNRLRRALADLREPMSDYEDLPAALCKLAYELQARTNIAVACVIDPALPTPPPDVRETVWYVAREALVNVERHAAATHATLTLHSEYDSWRLVISDDGTGVAQAQLNQPAHYGVVGMRERVTMLGGTFSVERGARGGAVVEAWLPMQVGEGHIA